MMMMTILKLSFHAATFPLPGEWQRYFYSSVKPSFFLAEKMTSASCIRH